MSTFDNYIHILECGNNVYDVFWQSGWDHWARIELSKDGNINWKAGKKLPFFVRNILNKLMNPQI